MTFLLTIILIPLGFVSSIILFIFIETIIKAWKESGKICKEVQEKNKGQRISSSDLDMSMDDFREGLLQRDIESGYTIQDVSKLYS